MQKFKKKLLNLIGDKNAFKYISKNALRIIDDNSYFEVDEEENIKKKKKFSIKNIFMLCDRIPVVDPNKKIKILFDFWMMIMISIRMFLTTIKLTFFIDDVETSSKIIPFSLKIIITFSFITDMFLSVNTGFYNKSGILILDKKDI